MVSSSDEDDTGDMKTTLTETVPDPDEEHVPKRTYQLREKRASVPLNQQMVSFDSFQYFHIVQSF